MKVSEYLGLSLALGITAFSGNAIVNLNNSVTVNDYIKNTKVTSLMKEKISNEYDGRNDILISPDGSKVSLKNALNKKGISIFKSPVQNTNHAYLVLSNPKEENNFDINYDNLSKDEKDFVQEYEEIIKKIVPKKRNNMAIAEANNHSHTISIYENTELNGNHVKDIKTLYTYFHELGHLYIHDYYNVSNYKGFDEKQFFSEAHSDIFSYLSLQKYYKNVEPENYFWISSAIDERFFNRYEKILNTIETSEDSQDTLKLYTNFILIKFTKDISQNEEIQKKSPEELEIIANTVNKSFKKYLDDNNISKEEIFNLNKDAEKIYNVIKEELSDNYQLLTKNNTINEKNKLNGLKG